LKPSLEPRTELHCNGTIPETPVMYRYTAMMAGDEVVSSATVLGTNGRTAMAFEDGDAVTVAFDFVGEANGGAFTFFPIGEFLGVDYIDPDQNLFWSLFGCFDGEKR
jgi:hypothetical protein